ncbi:MAG: ribosomal RNA small subunit methyltransferase A [Spirochaetes bacterium]|nr:ribosomal RNA small subunit methyltransferase A [Spirochaetota bacterium]
MNTKTIIETINRNHLYPNKKLGQNFLCNDGILKRIVEVSDVNKNDNILEIGPGLGDLTAMLAEKAGRVTAVEIDAGLSAFLNEKFYNYKNIKLIHADFLKADLNDIFTKSIANLPYYCSSEILFHLAIKYKIKQIFVMLQKEMSERILSRPGTKNYGAMTVALGLHYESRTLFNIDRKSFHPQPDVSSSFIYLKRKEDNELNGQEETIFQNIVKAAFWGRRKTLKKCLMDSPHSDYKKELILNVFSKLNLDENIRGENLSIREFKEIARSISKQI